MEGLNRYKYINNRLFNKKELIINKGTLKASLYIRVSKKGYNLIIY